MPIIQCFNEWITLADAHVLLGTTPDGGAEDIRVQGMIDDIDAMITVYLQRNLKHCEYSEVTFRPNGSFLSLNNWPIISFTSITVDGLVIAETDFEIDMDLGLLYYADQSIAFGGSQPKNITVQYIAGYILMPKELVVMFNTLLTERNVSGGAASAGGTGAIKKVSLVGVAAVEFDTGGSSVAYSGIDRSLGVPEELKPFVGLIDRYRSDRTIGVI